MFISTHRSIDGAYITSWVVSQEHASVGNIALQLSASETIYLTISEASEVCESLSKSIDLARQEVPL